MSTAIRAGCLLGRGQSIRWKKSNSMNDQADKQDAQTETLIIGIADRARNLYLTRQMLCTEAVVTALNQGLKGGLTDVQATAVSAPFCVALGESGCLCGALSGAVLATGISSLLFRTDTSQAEPQTG